MNQNHFPRTSLRGTAPSTFSLAHIWTERRNGSIELVVATFQFCEVKTKQVRMRESQEQCSEINHALSQVAVQLPHVQKTLLSHSV